jgi:hypothetical protein
MIKVFSRAGDQAPAKNHQVQSTWQKIKAAAPAAAFITKDTRFLGALACRLAAGQAAGKGR